MMDNKLASGIVTRVPGLTANRMAGRLTSIA